jgi:hypothetical protein
MASADARVRGCRLVRSLLQQVARCVTSIRALSRVFGGDSASGAKDEIPVSPWGALFIGHSGGLLRQPFRHALARRNG